MRSQQLTRHAPIALFILLFCCLWIFCPSRNYHPDGLNELLQFENGRFVTVSRHPAAEPAIDSLYRLVRSVSGRAPDTIRLVQIWNALWITLFLLAQYYSHLSPGNSPAAALGYTLLLGGAYAAMFLALDPYLYYLAPAFALFALALLLLRRYPRPNGFSGSAIVALLLGAVSFYPILTLVLPVLFPLALAANRNSGAAARKAWLWPAAFCLVPIAYYYLCFYRHEPIAHSSLYGIINRQSLERIQLGVSGALYPVERGARVFAVFDGARDWRSLLILCSFMLLILIPLLTFFFCCRNYSRIRFAEAVCWVCGAACAGLFAAWWDPAQPRFWLLPYWLLGLALASLTAELNRGEILTQKQRRTQEAAILLAGIALFAANFSAYALPASRESNWQQALALAARQALPPGSWVVEREFSDLYLEYFGRFSVLGMIELVEMRPADKSTFAYFQQFLHEQRAAGRRCFFHLPRASETWVTKWLAGNPKLDFTETDFGRIDWGETIRIFDQQYREILEIHLHGN